jgi:NADH-quinone oxidoreductase subunit J
MMLVFGVAVILNRNPIASALSLVVSFLGLSALFISLDAYFIATIQILVYAGAVMVLFLFIIMLLDLRAGQRRKLNLAAAAGGLVIVVLFVAQLASVLDQFPAGKKVAPALASGRLDDVRNVGMALFTGYNLPLQIVGTLLLVATVGVVILSKRELK